MNDLLLTTLLEFGLSDKEVRIYLALLELELATVFELAKYTGINRSSAYVEIEALKKKCLVGISDDNKIRRYIAVSPDVLAQMAQTSWKKHEAIKDNLLSILPDLKALHKGTKRRPIVKVYEGKEGLINVISATLKNREKFMRYSSPAENLINIVPEFLDLYGMKRIELGIKIHTILPSNKSARELINTSPKLYKAVLIPKEHYRFSSDFAVWDNKIGYASIRGKDITSIIIESEEIAENMKNLFDMAYKEGRRIGREEGDLI